METQKNPQVEELVAAAQRYVKRALGAELDLSPESLPIVDYYLNQVPKDSTAVRDLVLVAMGAYFGEVLRRRFGGRWLKQEGNIGGWLLLLSPHEVRVCPGAMTAEALADDAVDGVDAGLEVDDRYLKILSLALDRSGPVDRDHYYSLCGKYETIEKVVETINVLTGKKR